MTITKRKMTIDLSEEEKDSVTRTIAILRGLESADMCDDDYEELMRSIHEDLNDVAEMLNNLLNNISDYFTPTEESTERTSW